MKIYLVGYMASGKTTIGQLLAARLGWQFADTDDVMAQHDGMSCSDIMREKGEAYFRELERKALDEVSAMDAQVVVATGGGVPCFFGNMERMNAVGLTVFLDWSAEALQERLLLTDLSTRPLLSGKSESELLHFVTEQLAKRMPHYTQARQVVRCDGLTDEEIIERIIYNGNLC